MLKVAVAIVAFVTAQTLPVVNPPRISQQDFKKLFVSKNVVIVDTRSADAYERGHIPGAILLPLEGLPTWAPEYERTVGALKAAKSPIVTYCA